VCRYDRNYVPNVALSVQPFEEVRKQRAAESVCPGVSDDVDVVSRRRQRPPVTDRDLDLDLDLNDDDDDDDTESVSSDKRKTWTTLCLKNDPTLKRCSSKLLYRSILMIFESVFKTQCT